MALFAGLMGLFAYSAPVGAASNDTGQSLYVEHCAECHHRLRLGLTAPPLIPQLFSRSVKGKLEEVIRKGLPATQMPSFSDTLTEDQIKLIAGYIKTPVDEDSIKWTLEDISASREDMSQAPAGETHILRKTWKTSPW